LSPARVHVNHRRWHPPEVSENTTQTADEQLDHRDPPVRSEVGPLFSCIADKLILQLVEQFFEILFQLTQSSAIFSEPSIVLGKLLSPIGILGRNGFCPGSGAFRPGDAAVGMPLACGTVTGGLSAFPEGYSEGAAEHRRSLEQLLNQGGFLLLEFEDSLFC